MQAKEVVRGKFAKAFSAHIGWEIKQFDRQSRHSPRASEEARA